VSAGDWLAGFAYLGGAGVVGAALALAFATNRSRTRLLLGLGLALGIGFVLLAYFSAPTDASESRCSDCAYYGGRYWEPQLVIALLVWNLGAWWAAVLLAASVRRSFAGRRDAEPGEPVWR
jgi:hypothetical protein